MSNLPYFRWYPADAIGDQKYSALSDEELGFFHRCLNVSWLNEGIPSDLDELAATMRVSRRYLDKVWVKVGKCFESNGCVRERLVNPRQEKERSYAVNKSLKAANAAKVKSANAQRTHSGRTADVVQRTEGPICADDALRAYESDIYTSLSSKGFPKSSFEDLNEAWKWFCAEYPEAVNEFTDLKLFLAVVETDSDITELKTNLPLWKRTQRWRDGYWKSATNFLSERVFKVTPKPDVKKPQRERRLNGREQLLESLGGEIS